MEKYFQTANEYLQKAEDLQLEITKMTEAVEKRIKEASDSELRDAVETKEKEVRLE